MPRRFRRDEENPIIDDRLIIMPYLNGAFKIDRSGQFALGLIANCEGGITEVSYGEDRAARDKMFHAIADALRIEE